MRRCIVFCWLVDRETGNSFVRADIRSHKRLRRGDEKTGGERTKQTVSESFLHVDTPSLSLSLSLVDK